MAAVEPRPFTLTLNRAFDRIIMIVGGELDCLAKPVLEATLQDVIERQGHLDVAIDLAALDFIDSRGLLALMSGDRMAKSIGGELTLSGAEPHIQRVFDIAGLKEHFTFTLA